MTVVSPQLKKLQEEGEMGRQKINQWTRYLTVVLAGIQTSFVAHWLQVNGVGAPGWGFRLSTVLTLTTGTIFLMWLGEQITSRGVGNGISLLIFAGIVAVLPQYLFQALELTRTGPMNSGTLFLMLILVIAVTVAIVFMERSQRRLLVQYPKRQVGNRMFGGDTSFLPLKINTSGVIPPIFASSLLLLPATVMGFAATANLPEYMQWLPL